MSINSEESEAKHSRVRGIRRERQATRAKRNQPRPSRQKQRNIVVRAELRDEPDVRKIARALIQHAIAEAEHAAQRADTPRVSDGESSPVEDRHV